MNLGGLSDLLDIDVVEAGEDRVVATMQVSEKHHQPFGVLHGGATVTLAETVASVGANVASPEGRRAAGMEINANHLRPVVEGQLTATAEPVHTGRTSHVWRVVIVDDDDRKICVSRCTLTVRPESELKHGER
jgi:1,4-dihydroxy-2-naphthoyl-CoA hydrolase